MHIEEKQPTETSEAFTIHVPIEHFETYVDAFINSKAKTFRKDGFRPGKAPLDVVRAHFIDDACAWAEERVVNDGWSELKKQYADRKWAGHSIYNIDASDEKLIKVNITCEVWPDLDLTGKTPPSFERIKLELSSQTLKDKIIPAMLASHKTYKPAEKDEVAALGDILTVRMYFRHKGKEIPNSRVKSQSFSLNEEMMRLGQKADSLHGSLANLAGKKVEDVVRGMFKANKEFNWGQRSLVGEKIECEYRLEGIEKTKQTSIKDLATHFDVDEKTLESHILARFNHYAELVQAMREKREIFDYLNDVFPFDVAETRWKQEVASILESYQAEELDQESEDIAKRRVRLGIIINKLSEKCDKLGSVNFCKAVELYALTQKASSVIFMTLMNHFVRSPESLSNEEKGYVDAIYGAVSEWQVARHVLDQIAEPQKILDWEQCQKEWKLMLPWHFLEDDFVVSYLLNEQIIDMRKDKPTDEAESADDTKAAKKKTTKKNESASA